MSIIIKQQDQIEVFRNEDGGISIQQLDPFELDHVIITFQDEHAMAICQAIQSLVEIDENQIPY